MLPRQQSVPIGDTWLERVSAAEAAGLHCPDADHVVANFVSDSSPDGTDCSTNRCPDCRTNTCTDINTDRTRLC